MSEPLADQDLGAILRGIECGGGDSAEAKTLTAIVQELIRWREVFSWWSKQCWPSLRKCATGEFLAYCESGPKVCSGFGATPVEAIEDLKKEMGSAP